MSNYIDRNAAEMMSFSKKAIEVIDEMTFLLRKVEGLLDASSVELDEPTQKQITVLHECCNEFYKHIEVYRNVADSVYQKGKNLDKIRNGEW